MFELQQYFENRVPEDSLFGREWKALKEKQLREKTAFENAPDKMDYSTTEYRRVNFAIESFLEEWVPKFQALDAKTEAENTHLEDLDTFTEKALRHHKMDRMQREDIIKMWSLHVTERMTSLLPEGIDKFKRIDPQAVHKFYAQQDAFDNALNEWVNLSCPWDGSKAMHAMFDWLNAAHLIKHAND